MSWLQEQGKGDLVAETINQDIEKNNSVLQNKYSSIETEYFDYTVDMNE